jgi:small subunit ribosomal protein S21
LKRATSWLFHVRSLGAARTGAEACPHGSAPDRPIFPLKVLKKEMQREGVFSEMKLGGHYEKPSEKRANHVRCSAERLRSQLDRDDLRQMAGRAPAAFRLVV